MALPIIIDNGSYSIRASPSSDNTPETQIPCFKGSSLHKRLSDSSTSRSEFIGQDWINNYLNLSSSHISSLTDWSQIIQHIYIHHLRLPFHDHPILMSESHFCSHQERRNLAEVLFGEFQVPSVCFASSAVLSLYATGKLHGCMLSSGYSSSFVVPIVDGYSIENATEKTNLAGKAVTDRFIKELSLSNNNVSFTSTSEHYLASKIKERVCFVSQEDGSLCHYVLPDGNVLNLGTERRSAPELLFTPTEHGVDAPGISAMTRTVLDQCSIEARAQLYSNIVLSGGNTLFRGFAQRLINDLSCSAPSKYTRIRVYAHKDRELSAWNGGTILANLSSFEKFSVSRKDYEESGGRNIRFIG
ncbi:hypothetical protein GEMRC1_008824 [Eukaryota sp. GEM-RC1]